MVPRQAPWGNAPFSAGSVTERVGHPSSCRRTCAAPWATSYWSGQPARSKWLCLGGRTQDSLQELACAWLSRRAEDHVGRAFFDNRAGVEEHDAIGNLPGKSHLVRGQHHRHPQALELGDDLQHFPDHLGIERRSDLVEQQEIGPQRQGADDGDALLLAAREPVWKLIRAARQTESVQQFQPVTDRDTFLDPEDFSRRERNVVDD
jgi:hypothetical protein